MNGHRPMIPLAREDFLPFLPFLQLSIYFYIDFGCEFATVILIFYSTHQSRPTTTNNSKQQRLLSQNAPQITLNAPDNKWRAEL